MTNSSHPWQGKRVGVLMGGISAEREVSLKTGAGVLKALLEKGFDAVALEWAQTNDLTTLLRENKIDVVWNALHGTYGEDGAVQGLLQCLKIPYTGSGVLASALAMDKILSKKIFEKDGVPTPPWAILGNDDVPLEVAKPLGYPLVVKPSREGSTVGITIVKSPAELDAAVELARKCHGETFFEKFIPGREISVALLDGEVLGTVEIRPRAAFYDYKAKYLSGDTEYLVPAPISPEIEAKSVAASRAAYASLGCVGHARPDIRIDEQGDVWVLEMNTLPGMTATSLLPKVAAHAGMDYATLVVRILRTAALRE